MTRPLVSFFVITYLLAWTCWGAAAAISHARVPANPVVAVLAGALFLLGTFAPGIVALALTSHLEGRAATEALVTRIFKAQVGARWYVFALAYMPAVKLSVAVLHREMTGQWPRFGDEPWYLMAGAILISTWVQAGEEIGWRGYALPRLSSRAGLAPAGIILGVIWAAWHLPLFFFSPADTQGQSFPLYLMQVTAVSVAMAWLYWRTGGSLLLVMIFHVAINNTKDIVPSAVQGAANPAALSTSVTAWLTVALLWTAAAYFLIQMRGKRTCL